VLQLVRAATFDELLSGDVDAAHQGAGLHDLAAARLLAWCKSAAAGDWMLFRRRLDRDELTVPYVQACLAVDTGHERVPNSSWIRDADWILAALSAAPATAVWRDGRQRPFDDVFLALADEAERRLSTVVGSPAIDGLAPAARADLRNLLLESLCGLCTALLYDEFDASGRRYDEFIAGIRCGGFQRIIDGKPVLLRLLGSLTRQWLDTSREFLTRLHADVDEVRRSILGVETSSRVARIEGGLSDPHRGGHTVLAVAFEDGLQVLYKPKDLRVDVGWHSMVERLNVEAPVQLRAARALARNGYGWTEFIEHTGCEPDGCKRFFVRAGAWLALLHGFAASDIHQENLIAAGEHPVPVDLETILQPADVSNGAAVESAAHHAARGLIQDSVLAVGLLPGYARAAGNRVYSAGGIAADWTSGERLSWKDVNSDAMRAEMVEDAGAVTSNLPHVGGHYAVLGDHLDDFLRGFREYAIFLTSRDASCLLQNFAGLPVRRVVRPTQFYYLLRRRLIDDRTMNDGVIWSAQADFLARLADWNSDYDPMWPLQRAERSALLELNIPHFTIDSDGCEITDGADTAITVPATPGLQRAHRRLRSLDDREIDWQTEVIRQTFGQRQEEAADELPRPLGLGDLGGPPTRSSLLAKADATVDEIAGRAIRKGPSAAWVGVNWLPDSDVGQLAVVGHDLYNGSCGIALFLAAHSRVARRPESGELALAAIAYLRAELKSRNASHLARVLGIGGATGLGSVVYALTAMSALLQDDGLLDDGHRAATLVTDDLITADKRFDVVGGAAGAILGLLRLHRDTGSDDALDRAVTCGRHVLTRSCEGSVLSGMSHGTAGFGYALQALAHASGSDEFVTIANDSGGGASDHHWRSQWCHGAVGIGLASLGMAKYGGIEVAAVSDDVERALIGATNTWPGHVDTLCCGSLGSIEFVREAGSVLQRGDLTDLAASRLGAVLHTAEATGDHRWNGGARRFNLGLFRGLAGVGYACLRATEDTLPNVLIWE